MTVRISDWRLLGALLTAFFAAGMVGGPGTTVDETMSQAAATWRGAAPAFTDFAKSFTEVGGGRLTLSLTALTALSLLIRRRFWLALLLVVTVLAERELVEWLKELTARPRPMFGAINPLSLAYPSGHAANSMTAFLAVAMLAVPAAYRRPVVIAALTLSFLVGLSRIYLGVHWPSDVIGGWALGLMAVGLAITIAERSDLLRHEPEHEVIGGHRLASREDESA
jgi:undecaprenyl-diphosphatase